MNGSKNSRNGTTRPRWWSELPGWERREIRSHRRRGTDRVDSDHRQETIGLDELRRRRAAGEPLEYILGHVHVGSLTFRVDERALIPRPETETLARILVDRMADLPDGPLVDCGTGTGFLAGWLEHHTDRSVVAVDRHAAPLSLASENRDLNGWTFRLVRGDRLRPLGKGFAAIAANLPYVRPDERAPAAPVTEYEPEEAYRLDERPSVFFGELLFQAARCLRPGGELWLELDPPLIEQLTSRAAGSPWASRDVHRDLEGRDRFLRYRRAANAESGRA